MTEPAPQTAETSATEAAAHEAAAAPAAYAPHVQVIKPEHTGARVSVLVQPEEKHLSMPRPKTSRQLLAALGREARLERDVRSERTSDSRQAFGAGQG